MKNLVLISVIVFSLLRSAYCCKCVDPSPGEEVCGSNGKTYKSDCYLFCDSLMQNQTDSTVPCLSKVHDGECSSEPCICEDACQSVCGSDGQTYGNDCTLECAQQFNPHLEKNQGW